MFHVKQIPHMAEIISICPVCDNTAFSPFLPVKDYFLSKEDFSILSCNACGFRFVSPRPAKSEINKYYQSDEYISHGADKGDLISRIYKVARMVSIRRKFRILEKYTAGIKILDIGCGTAEFLSYCQKRGYNTTGIEPNDKARGFAKSINSVNTFEQVELLEGMNGSFNCITMWHVLEHIHNLNELITQVKQLLAPRGIFIVAVPNSNSWDAGYYKQFWGAYDVPRHLYHFTEKSFDKLVSKHGFEIRKIYPQKLDAFYVSMLSEKYKSGKNNFFNAACLGLWSNFRARMKDRGHSSQVFILSLKNS